MPARGIHTICDTRRMDASIDRTVGKVLDEYHLRIESERPMLRRAREEGTLDAILGELLLPVGPESGRLVNVLAKSLTTATILELGTANGYSALWLAEAARASGGRVITIELSEKKSAYARQM